MPHPWGAASAGGRWVDHAEHPRLYINLTCIMIAERVAEWMGATA